jgi:hypothetical protein
MSSIQVVEIPQYNFCPADEEILKQLAQLSPSKASGVT